MSGLTPAPPSSRKRKGTGDRTLPRSAKRHKGPVAVSDGRAVLTYEDLQPRFRKLGAKPLPVSDGPITPLPDVPWHSKKGFFADIAAKPAETIYDKDWFNTKYHQISQGQDEILSTSSTREFIRGYFDALPASQAERANAAILFENLSKASRTPTVSVGFATRREAMQHPSSRDRAVFAEPKGDAVSLHTFLDRERAMLALEAGEAASNEKGATKEKVVKEMLRAAAEFTANYMQAPATASNVRGFGRLTAGEKLRSLEVHVAAREYVKDLAVKLGSVRSADIPDERGRERLKRRFDPARRGKREISPRRLTEGRFITDRRRFKDLDPALATVVPPALAAAAPPHTAPAATPAATPASTLAPAPFATTTTTIQPLATAGGSFPPAVAPSQSAFPPAATPTTQSQDQFAQAAQQHVQAMDFESLMTELVFF